MTDCREWVRPRGGSERNRRPSHECGRPAKVTVTTVGWSLPMCRRHSRPWELEMEMGQLGSPGLYSRPANVLSVEPIEEKPCEP